MKFLGFRMQKRAIFLAAGVLLLFAAAYWFVIPTVVANHYLDRLDAKVAGAQAKIKTATSGPSMAVFEDPDIKLADRQALITAAAQNTQAAQTALKDVGHANQLSPLPGNGFAGDYHQAIVRKERIHNAVEQSRQVLDEYSQLLGYISSYTSLQRNLDEHLESINNVEDFNALAGRGREVARVASQVRADQEYLATLKPPAGFAQLHNEALSTFSQAASGFDRLAAGLNQGVDAQIYGGVAIIELAIEKNQVEDKNLLVGLARSSPTLLQLAELSEKVEHAQGR